MRSLHVVVPVAKSCCCTRVLRLFCNGGFGLKFMVAGFVPTPVLSFSEAVSDSQKLLCRVFGKFGL